MTSVWWRKQSDLQTNQCVVWNVDHKIISSTVMISLLLSLPSWQVYQVSNVLNNFSRGIWFWYSQCSLRHICHFTLITCPKYPYYEKIWSRSQFWQFTRLNLGFFEQSEDEEIIKKLMKWGKRKKNHILYWFVHRVFIMSQDTLVWIIHPTLLDKCQ